MSQPNPQTEYCCVSRADVPEMHSDYFVVRFRVEGDWSQTPNQFGLITGFATTGEVWTDAENREADERLRATLGDRATWIRRISGYTPETGHCEPGWGVDLGLDELCDLGVEFHQDAIYYIVLDRLYVAKCAPGQRHLVEVGEFCERITDRE